LPYGNELFTIVMMWFRTSLVRQNPLVRAF